jgi:hypothetical protein
MVKTDRPAYPSCPAVRGVFPGVSVHAALVGSCVRADMMHGHWPRRVAASTLRTPAALALTSTNSYAVAHLFAGFVNVLVEGFLRPQR